ncbi:MAG: hypothetical protein HYV07_16115 [Deltaproteobacteria bacterium]|nr:hypothetical protein [Deltaproteobacteria bacterium]
MSLTLLRADSCFDAAVFARQCSAIDLTLAADGEVKTIPDCGGINPLFTVRHMETYTVTGLDTNLLALHPRTDSSPLGWFDLESTGRALPNQTTELSFNFEPIGRGPGPAAFRGSVLIRVTFSGVVTPPDCSASLPRAEASVRIEGAIFSWLRRCQTDLSIVESERIARRYATWEGSELSDLSLTFDGTTAGTCACEIDVMPCSAMNPFEDLPSCEPLLGGTLSAGAICSRSEDCSSGHCLGAICGECWDQVGLGESCIGAGGELLRCPADQFCNYALTSPVCELRAGVGDSCFDRPCLAESSFVFPRTICDPTSWTCQLRGRAGDSCTVVPCHELFDCINEVCELRPGDGDACLPAAPQGEGTTDPQLCRISGGHPTAGEVCIPTGPTETDGVCAQPPTLGQDCGIGVGLSARCAPGLVCDGINPADLVTSFVSACVPGFDLGDACWFSEYLGDPCGQGTCYLDVCTELCVP